MSKSCIHAVIVAAGRSNRMNGIDKIFMLIDGMTVLERSVGAFACRSDVCDITVAVSRENMNRAAMLLAKYGATIVTGGATRTESVKNCIDIISDSGIVAIHDGARPLVTDDIITAAVNSAMKYGSGIPAVSPKDTLRAIGGETLPRDSLVCVQTPQCFTTVDYRRAIELACAEGGTFTDDAGIYEKYIGMVTLTQGSYRNIKITTPEDAAIATALLK